jgi:Flp pilus assembly protein TadG
MNTSQSSKNLKKRAQALVEFALIVPVLMMILYGVIETGRFLFIYASTITAARQAVRYGTALGDSPNGPKYFNDCVGIEAAARKIQFLNYFQSVNISYDKGLKPNGTSDPFTVAPIPTCPSGGTGTLTPTSGNRVIVEVTAQYTPILTLLPFKPFLVKSTSARTILTDISIVVPSPVPNQGVPVLSAKLTSQTEADWKLPPNPITGTFEDKTTPFTFQFKITNNGNGTGVLNPAFSVDTVIKGITHTTTCTTQPGSLAVGDPAYNCGGQTYSYTPDQDDLDAGSFTGYAIGKATSNSTLLTSTGVPIVFTAIQRPSIVLNSITTDKTSAANVGDQVRYTYKFTNTGNVRIRAPYTITDDHFTNIDCSGATSPLDPNTFTTCTKTYTITQKDIDDELLINTATVHAIYGAGGLTTPESNSAQAIVRTGQFFMTVTATPSSSASAYGQVITFTYTIFNNSGGNITVTGVTHQNPGVVINSNCNNKTIAYGSTLTCTGTYPISTTDYETLPSIDDVVYATRTSGSPISTKPKSISVSLVQVKTLTLSLVSATTSWLTGSTAKVGDIVTFNYSLKNDGNVTLAAPFTINDGTVTTCSSISSLAPPSSANCTLATSYTVTQADIDAGSITKIATAYAVFGGSPITSNTLSSVVVTYPNARFKVGVTVTPTNPITISGSQATFTYTITNTGGRDLTTFNLTTSQFNTFSCTGTIVVGGPPITCKQSKIPPATITDTITAANARDGATTVTSTTFSPSSATVYLCTSATLYFGTPTFSSNARIETWPITNDVGMTLTIKEIAFTWITGNGNLSNLTLTGYPNIFNGPPNNSSGGFDLSGTWTLAQGSSSLVTTFTQSGFGINPMNIYTTLGNECKLHYP